MRRLRTRLTVEIHQRLLLEGGIVDLKPERMLSVCFWILVVCHSPSTSGAHSPLPPTGEPLYMGCYKRFYEKFVNGPSSTDSIKGCLRACASLQLPVAALSHLSQCYCGNDFGPRVSSNKCNKLCNMDDGICGGNGYYAAYIAVPSYVGCYIDSTEVSLKSPEKEPTIEDCLDTCHLMASPYKVTALPFKCFCGRVYSDLGVADPVTCDVDCWTSSKELCAGAHRSSIFSVGYIPVLDLTFDQVFHCEKGVDQRGNCELNLCQKGWKGKRCEWRDCSVDNGLCGINKCIEGKVSPFSYSECQCSKDQSSKTFFNECEDTLYC